MTDEAKVELRRVHAAVNINSALWLSAGVFRGGHDVLVRARLALADGVTMQVTVRSADENVVDVILASVG